MKIGRLSYYIMESQKCKLLMVSCLALQRPCCITEHVDYFLLLKLVVYAIHYPHIDFYSVSHFIVAITVYRFQ